MLARALALLVMLFGAASVAAQKGDALVISLNNGKTVTGTLINETSNGFLLKTPTGTQLVNFTDIADIQEPGKSVPPPPPQPAYPEPRNPSGRPRVQQEQPQYRNDPRAGAIISGAARVSFFSKNDRNSYQVLLGGQSCQTPCMLEVDPGAYQVHTTGSGTIRHNLIVPNGESFVTLQHQAGGAGAGLVLLTAGGGVALIGVALMALNLVVGLIVTGAGVLVGLVGLIVFAAAPKESVDLRPGRAPFSQALPEHSGAMFAWGT